jgi:signal transduction histidine kinase
MASIGKMASSITHELNTPITYMKSNLELMENDLDDIVGNDNLKNDLLETYTILNTGLQRLQNIINSTNTISRKGKIGFHSENLYSSLIFSTQLIYNRSKHLMPVYINDTLFDLDLASDYENYPFSIIKEKIEQVWIIILNNACDEFERSSKKYADRKMIIEIISDGDKIKILFKDNANEGIPEDILPNIFDPFVSTKLDKGTGVGLNIAKEIIEEHYGIIKAYNEKEFAIFEVEL